MSTYVNLGSGGADTWIAAVASAAALPATGALGQVTLVQDTGALMYWNGAAWAATSGGGGGGAGATDVDGLTILTTTPASGKVTQVVTASQPTASVGNVGATGVFGYAISVSVPTGRWIISGLAGFADNGAVLTSAIEATISNTTTAGGVTADNIVTDDAITGGAALSRSFIVPSQTVYLSGATTYYVNTKFNYSAGAPQHYGNITARRIG